MRSARKVGNGRVSCDSLIKTSLNPWKEEFEAATPVAAPQDPTATPQDTTAAAAEVTTSNNIKNNAS